MVMAVLLFATLIAIYAFWIRPILQSRPAFRELYDKEENFFAALREKLKGIKQKLSSVIVIVAGAAVTGYDFFAPIISGVDMSSLTSRVPSWAWPLVLISLTALFQFLRNLADKRHLVELTDATAPDQGDVVRCGPGLRALSAGPSSTG
ncbi:MAG: hypothetical protein FJX62_02015 [Alphaproteobacteria bacterium]|nr:hypothetical protein [Alphaproteobacteria bacterium]